MESPDQLQNWVQHHRKAFDTLEPRADLWGAIERQLDADEVIKAAVAPAVAAPVPPLTASRGGRFAAGGWWQMAAAAVVVFTLGYGLRMQTEPAAPAVALTNVPASTEVSAPAEEAAGQQAVAVNGFRNDEPDPAVQAALLTNDRSAEVTATPAAATDTDRELTERLRRLEARYETLLAYHQQPQAAKRNRFTSARPLADEWDREMAALDSGYAALRLELTRNPNTEEVVEAMNRNLHLRVALLNQQVRALDAMQQSRHRTARPQPRRPPTVNPDAPVPAEDAPGGGWHSPQRAPSPAPMLDAATRPQPQFDALNRHAPANPTVGRAVPLVLAAA